MISAFVLVITITIGLGSEQKTFQMSFPKESEAECMTDAEKFEVPLPFVTIQAECQPQLAPSPNKDDDILKTQSTWVDDALLISWADLWVERYVAILP